ncbi:MAG: lactate utilization protein [Methanoregulaceae archaeon]|nr:lactate utilization protein [Methanoregulaceae archaeon]
MSDRDTILSRLGPPGAVPEAPGTRAEVPAIEGDLWAHFAERLEALGGVFFRSSGPLDDAALSALTGLDLGEAYGDGRPGDPWTAPVGITWADLAIAETGSVVLSTGPDRPRLASLTPPTHVVLVREEAIVAHLEEAMPAYASGRTSVLVTGPSRTADIEGVLVRGVHGPGELIVVCVGG